MEHTTVIEGSDPKNVGAAPNDELLDWIERGGKKPQVPKGAVPENMQKNKKVDVVSASEGDAPPAEGQDDCGESKKGVSDELSAPAESVKLSEDGGLFDNADRDLTNSEEEDNVEWGPENLRCSRLMWRKSKADMSDVLPTSAVSEGVSDESSAREEKVEAREVAAAARELDVWACENSAAACENTIKTVLTRRS
ncbi:hypothetical protein Tco_1247371 [Tanacetum coccineum]